MYIIAGDVKPGDYVRMTADNARGERVPVGLGIIARKVEQCKTGPGNIHLSNWCVLKAQIVSITAEHLDE